MGDPSASPSQLARVSPAKERPPSFLHVCCSPAFFNLGKTDELDEKTQVSWGEGGLVLCLLRSSSFLPQIGSFFSTESSIRSVWWSCFCCESWFAPDQNHCDWPGVPDAPVFYFILFGPRDMHSGSPYRVLRILCYIFIFCYFTFAVTAVRICLASLAGDRRSFRQPFHVACHARYNFLELHVWVALYYSMLHGCLTTFALTPEEVTKKSFGSC